MRVLVLLSALSCLALNGYAVEKTVVSQPLTFLGDYLITSVGIGSKPPQFFDLYLDASDDKMVILDSSAAMPTLDYSYDYVKNLFTPEASDSYTPSNQICRRGYYDGSRTYRTDGYFGSDLITLGGNTFEKTARFCDLKPERTGVTSPYNDPIRWFQLQPHDGFLGVKPGGEDILQKIGLPVRQISLFVDQKAANKEPDNAGWITFGGPDTDHCGNFRTFPSDDYDTWRAWVSSVTYNGKTIKGTYSTRFEFHNKTLVVPQDIYSSITNYFGGSTNIGCSSHQNPPDLILNIYGKDMKFPMNSLLKTTTGSSYCRLDLTTSSATDEDQIVLNRHILDKYCMLLDFENGNIGFADFKGADN